MEHAWRYAIRRAIETKKPSITAGGDAGAFIDAIARVDWGFPSFNSIRTADGTVLFMDRIPPKTLMRYLYDNFMLVTGSASSIASRVTQLVEHTRGGHTVVQELVQG